MVSQAKFIVTDTGGIQEQTNYLKIPGLTVRPNTERPITGWEGSNKLIKVDAIVPEIEKILCGKGKHGKRPKYWDGNAAQRIVKEIEKFYNL